MTDELPVGDKTYVSSKRASDISGYAQDYIGQLARNGEIAARRVGGLWYVYMDSLESYKTRSSDLIKNPHPETREPEKESEVLVSFDGKDYISANRASKITGYNQDYVGQLARSGKILSRQVGNRWYIDRDGIVAHKKEKDALLAAVQSESVGIQSADITEPIENVNVERFEEPELLRYMPEYADLTPNLKKEALIENEPEDIAPHPLEITRIKEYSIPVHVVRKSPTLEENIRPIHLRYSSSRPQKTSKRRFSIIAGISILALGIIISIGGFFLVPGHLGEPEMADKLLLASSAISTNAASGFASFANRIEAWISPELVYDRS